MLPRAPVMVPRVPVTVLRMPVMVPRAPMMVLRAPVMMLREPATVPRVLPGETVPELPRALAEVALEAVSGTRHPPARVCRSSTSP
jgi:hypothetical protein